MDKLNDLLWDTGAVLCETECFLDVFERLSLRRQLQYWLPRVLYNASATTARVGFAIDMLDDIHFSKEGNL